MPVFGSGTGTKSIVATSSQRLLDGRPTVLEVEFRAEELGPPGRDGVRVRGVDHNTVQAFGRYLVAQERAELGALPGRS